MNTKLHLNQYHLLKLIVIALMSFACFQKAPAQGTGKYWLFSASAGSTLDAMSSATQIVNGGVNGTSTVKDIGFSFSFGGVNYTQFSASSAGYMRLGATTNHNTVNSLLNTVATPLIAPCWDASTSATAANGGGVRMLLTGSAPNRILIVEWKQTMNTVTAGGVTGTFQVWLYETSNNIEFRYGSVVNTASASIGIAGVDKLSQNLSVTPNATVANSTYSCFSVNDAVSNGSVLANTTLSFAATTMNGAKTVAATGADFRTLDNAIGQLNWCLSPSGATTINIDPALTETLPSGRTIAPIRPAGMIVTATGTATNTITIQGNGGQPTLTPGIGTGKFDFALGIAGGDYITINNIKIINNVAATTNNAYCETGIGLFKEKYNTTIGNNGCQYVKITNCTITLNRKPNQTRNVANSNHHSPGETYFSRGIYATHFTYQHAGQAGYGTANSGWGCNYPQGIKTVADNHNNCEITGNSIDHCSIGIELSDGYLKGTGYTVVAAGTGNIIGKPGAGNTVSSWGADPGIVYGTSGYQYGLFMSGIVVSGQKDYTVEYNTVTNGVSETVMSYCLVYSGIVIGQGQDRQAMPQYAPGFFIKANNNTIDSVDATKYNASNKPMTGAYGLVVKNILIADNYNVAGGLCTGNIDVNNNTISNVKALSGAARGISSCFNDWAYRYHYAIAIHNYEWSALQTTGTVNIKNNTVTAISKLGNNASYWVDHLTGPIAGIYWTTPAANLYVENNIVGGSGTNGIIAGAATNTLIESNQVGLNGIFVNYVGNNNGSAANRDLISIKGNTVTNVSRYAANTVAYNYQRTSNTSGITIFRGATNNIIDSNTIQDMSVAHGLYNGGYYRLVNGIRIYGQPRNGSSTITVSNNTINNLTRTNYGNVASMAQGSGLTFMNGIFADFTTALQTKNIFGNTITNLTGLATGTVNEFRYGARIQGIGVRGRNAIGSAVNIYNNIISGIGGNAWSYAFNDGSLSANNLYRDYNVVGINAWDYQYCKIYDNKICNLSTSHTGYSNTNAYYQQGVVGIILGKSGTGGLAGQTKDGVYEAVYNNMIGDLSAPKMNSMGAIMGIYYAGYGRWARFYHNTIVLGDPTGGPTGRLSTSGGYANAQFGVSGITFHNYYINNKSYPIDFRNNLISINATGNGTATALGASSTGGFCTAWRTYARTAKGKRHLGFTGTTGGNIYYVNNDIRNYIFAQGSKYNTSNIINGYGYWRGSVPATYINTAVNLVNDSSFISGKYFNSLCGRYKAYWGGATESASYIDVDNNSSSATYGNWLTIPFVNSGAGCYDKYKIIAGASTVAAAGQYLSAPLNINADAFGTTRGATTVTIGAHEQPAATGSAPPLITLSYDPICDDICGGSKSFTAIIAPPAGYTVVGGAEAPRVYFRRIKNNSAFASTTSTTTASATAIVDNNLIFGDHLNNSSGPSGWRWVNVSSVSGNSYNFTINESLLSGGVLTSTYTIEYFVIASVTDGTTTITNWSGGDQSNACPSSTKLNNTTSGFAYVSGPTDEDGTLAVGAVNYGTNSIDGNTVADNYTVYRATDIKKYVHFANNNTDYTTANLTTPYNICTGEEIKLVPNFTVTVDAEDIAFDMPCVTYVMQRATNNAFTTGLSIVDTDTDPALLGDIPTIPGTYYYRVGLSCNGGTSLSVGYNSVYITVTVTDCPTNTTIAPADAVKCVGSATNVILSGTPTPAYYFVSSPIGKVYTNTAATPANATISVTPVDTSESGVWSTWVTGQTISALPNEGFFTGDVPKDDGGTFYQNSPAIDYGRGIALHVNKIVKLNNLKVLDSYDATDGSSGFTVSVYDKNGLIKLYQSAAITVGDGLAATVSFTNAWLAPGDYMIVADVSGANEAVVTGGDGLVTVSGNFVDSIPQTATPAVEITGGVEGYDITNLTGDNNYFFDLNFNAYCTSDPVPFNWHINDAICCATTNALAVGNIATGTQESGLVQSLCHTAYNGWIYYYVPDVSVDSTPGNVNQRKYIMAIHPNGNDWTPTDMVVHNLGTYSSTDGYIASDGTDSTGVMKYMFNIVNGNELTVNGGVNVRLFYNATEKANVDNNANFIDKGWFKFEGDKDALLASIHPDGIDGAIELVPSQNGTENGIPYVQFDGITSFSTFSYAGTTASNIVLPVTITTFTAALQDHCTGVELNWQTAAEQNSKSFTIQRSTDGRNWVNIGSVVAAGESNSLKSYSYTDNSVSANSSYYYRLQQNNMDGQYAYSRVLAVRLDCNSGKYYVYPNPVTEVLNIQTPLSAGGMLQIFNSIGRCIYSKALSTGTVVTVNTAGWSTGIYVVSITENGQQLYNGKVVKP